MTDRLYSLRAIERVDADGDPDPTGKFIKMGIDSGSGPHAFWISEDEAARIHECLLTLRVERTLSHRERHAVLVEQRRHLDRLVAEATAPIDDQRRIVRESLEEIYSEIGTPVKICGRCETAIFSGDPFYYAGEAALCEPCAPTTAQEIASLHAIVKSGEIPEWAKSEDDVIALAASLNKFLTTEKRLRKA